MTGFNVTFHRYESLGRTCVRCRLAILASPLDRNGTGQTINATFDTGASFTQVGETQARRWGLAFSNPRQTLNLQTATGRHRLEGWLVPLRMRFVLLPNWSFRTDLLVLADMVMQPVVGFRDIERFFDLASDDQTLMFLLKTPFGLNPDCIPDQL